jgi:hypothetical protein
MQLTQSTTNPLRHRPHRITIAAVLAVGIAVVVSELISLGGTIACGRVSIESYDYGWPMRSLYQVRTISIQGSSVRNEWHPLGIVINAFTSLFFVGSTYFVSERWLYRMKIRRQFRLIHLFALMTIAAIAFFALVDEPTLHILEMKLKGGISWSDFGDFSWLFPVPLLFGFVCSIFTIGYGLRILGRRFIQ